jgi:hypothetical protein
MPRYFRFEAQLQRIEPPIWRSFLLPSTASFADLHDAIQVSCDWDGSHLYTFLEASAHRGEISQVQESWAETPLESWFTGRGPERRKCIYWYDFGDDWMHEVTLEGVEEHSAGHGRRLIGGARAFPPEDCGGIPGYERCLAALKGCDDELLAWLDDWDPERFDLEEVRRRFELDLAPARNLARHLRGIVMAATSHEPGEGVITGIACKRRPKRRKCPGWMTVSTQSGRDEIEWCCSVCPDSGTIRGWRGGAHDLSGLAVAHAIAGGEEASIRIPAEVYGALIDEENLAIVPGRLLYSAEGSGEEVILLGDLDEIDELYEQACSDANHAPRGRRQKRLDAACEAFRSVLHDDVAEEDTEEERAAVAEAVRGLRLAPLEQEGIRLLYRQGRELYSRIGDDSGDRLAVTLRQMAESLVLQRRIREVLAVPSTDYRHLSLFLTLLEHTLESVEEFGSRAPESALQLCRRLLVGVGEIADEVHVDENELNDFAEEVARYGFALAKKCHGPTAGTRPLLGDLLELWSADRDETFYFVPDFVVELKLSKRERGWFSKQLEEKLDAGSGRRAADLEGLRNRLGAGG